MSKKNLFAGVRVELSPSLDLWMRGARYGTITKIEPVSQIATVKVDKVRKLQKIKIQDLSSRTRRLVGHPSLDHTLTGARVYFTDYCAGRLCVTPEVPPSTIALWVDPDALEGGES